MGTFFADGKKVRQAAPMKGQLVVVRAFGGEPALVSLIGSDSTTCYVTAPKGGESLIPIGFPIADVFEFEEKLFRDLATAYGRGDKAELGALWGSARPFAEEALN
jgi:hypothetical protein